MDSNNKIEPCLSRKSSEGKPQIFTTLRNIDLTLLTILKLHMSIKESLMQRKCLICPPRQSISLFRNCALYSLTYCLFAKAVVSLLPHLRCIYMSLSLRLESILGALDIEGSYDKQRTITIAPSPRSEPWSFLSSIGRLKLTIHSFYCATRPSAARKTNSVSFKPISSSITCFARGHRCYP